MSFASPGFRANISSNIKLGLKFTRIKKNSRAARTRTNRAQIKIQRKNMPARKRQTRPSHKSFRSRVFVKTAKALTRNRKTRAYQPAAKARIRQIHSTNPPEYFTKREILTRQHDKIPARIKNLRAPERN